MLNAVTKKFTDKSTIRQFKFIFYCDCCKKPVTSVTYDFISGFRDKVFLSGDEREARAIIYASDHKKELMNEQILKPVLSLTNVIFVVIWSAKTVRFTMRI